jgi:hypothetical protein
LVRRVVAPVVLCLALSLGSGTSCRAATDAPPAVTPAQLQALAGEYTDPLEPDTPLSFYVDHGKLIEESDRRVPTELTPVSATEFSQPDAKAKIDFMLDANGRGASLTFSSLLDHKYVRTGEAAHHLFHDYQRTEAMIAMRDGVKLHAVILKPADIATPLPILMQRTPYGVDETTRASFSAQRPELAREGYIYVAEDIRGRYKSEGTFVMSRPLLDDHGNKKGDRREYGQL